jgi:hypothetical protein
MLLTAPAPQAGVSTNSTTWAFGFNLSFQQKKNFKFIIYQQPCGGSSFVGSTTWAFGFNLSFQQKKNFKSHFTYWDCKNNIYPIIIKFKPPFFIILLKWDKNKRGTNFWHPFK